MSYILVIEKIFLVSHFRRQLERCVPASTKMPLPVPADLCVRCLVLALMMASITEKSLIHAWPTLTTFKKKKSC